jgi:hypothetical protein
MGFLRNHHFGFNQNYLPGSRLPLPPLFPPAALKIPLLPDRFSAQSIFLDYQNDLRRIGFQHGKINVPINYQNLLNFPFSGIPSAYQYRYA